MSQIALRLGSVLSAAALLLAPVGLIADRASAAPPSSPPGCSRALFDKPLPAYAARARSSAAFTDAAARNGQSAAALGKTAAADHTLWLDRCGKSYYVEQKQADATTGAASASSSPATATVPLADTFTLESRPGSNRTIYLDFRGGTVTGTAWNSSYGTSISVDPYSITAPADTAFSDAELTEMQRAWQVVAEDYAPFDVNVTTKDPGDAAIDRSSSTDAVYGTRVMITAGGPIYTQCGCGGMAYINVFNNSGSNHAYYQPAWVFTNGTGTNGKYFGEASSHESGHNFGLQHDGSSTTSYYSGASPWAPIMGSSYSQPVSQWSRGEYADANNAQDDLAVIATGAPLRADDHGDTAGSATALSPDVAVNGLVGTRTDVDAFTFSAAGATTLGVQPAVGLADLDVQLRIVDSTGTTVATVDPAAARLSFQTTQGLDATWSVTLPSTPSQYTAYVDGVGTGDPLTAGKYTDYASLGNYQITLTTQAAPQSTPLTATGTDPAAATVGTTYSATPVTASGGSSGYRFAAAGLPTGLSIASSTGTVTGTPTATGSSPVTVTVTDSAGATAQAAVTMTVDAAPVAVPDQTVAEGTVGTAYSARLVASGGDGSYTWSAGSGVPAGLSLSSAGVLSGTPSATGTWSFPVTASSAGGSASGTITVTVGSATTSPLAFVTSSLPGGKVGRAYSVGISTSGGSPAYTWTRTGSLPAGLSLSVASDGRSAVLAGTPTARGKSSFTLKVTDGTGASVSRTFSVNISR